MNLALAAVTLAALYFGSRAAAARAAAIGWLVFSVPHAMYHFRHLGHYETADQIGNVVSLSLGIALAVAALVLTGRPASARRPLVQWCAVNRYLNSRMQTFGTTIFAEMSALAVATGSINLGQGFPDTDGPDVVEAGRDRRDPRPGTTSIRRASAFPSCAPRSPRTNSASTGSSSTPTPRCSSPRARPKRSRRRCSRLCEPGDEVVTFEPYYDSYAACIAMAGARPARRDACGRPTYDFDPDELPRRDHASHES